MKPLSRSTFRAISRRGWRLLVALFGAAAGAWSLRAEVERVVVDHDYVRTLAAELAARPFAPADSTVPRKFRELTPEAHATIRFRPEHALWAADPVRFRVSFDHLGADRLQAKQLFEFSPTHVQRIPFARRFFDYGEVEPSFWSTWRLEYAGFHVWSAPDPRGAFAELAEFGDDGERRSVGIGQRYGVIAKPLLADAAGETARAAFVKFWLGKPLPGAGTLTLHALLDGPAAAGAYTFVLEPGEETQVDVRASLYFRAAAPEPGLVPITGSFWFGENSANRFGDYRPEVHTVDGLLIAPDATRRVWRPLANPAKRERTRFETPALAGFGLLQRDRDYRDYQDREGRYERRPGLWIQTRGGWPAGHVTLIEEPALVETENVTAYWTPATAVAPGRPLELAWIEHWTARGAFGGPPARVMATRQTVRDGGVPGRAKFVIDYDPESTAELVPDAGVTAAAEAVAPGRVLEHRLERGDDAVWRLVLRVEAPAGGAPVDLRARLFVAGRQVSELWTYRWEP